MHLSTHNLYSNYLSGLLTTSISPEILSRKAKQKAKYPGRFTAYSETPRLINGFFHIQQQLESADYKDQELAQHE